MSLKLTARVVLKIPFFMYLDPFLALDIVDLQFSSLFSVLTMILGLYYPFCSASIIDDLKSLLN